MIVVGLIAVGANNDGLWKRAAGGQQHEPLPSARLYKNWIKLDSLQKPLRLLAAKWNKGKSIR